MISLKLVLTDEHEIIVDQAYDEAIEREVLIEEKENILKNNLNF